MRTPADAQLRLRTRQSIAYFVHPNWETIIEPIIGGPESYEPVEAGAYVLEKLAASYQ